MSADYNANVCKLEQERVELAMLYATFYVYLSSSDAHILYTNSNRPHGPQPVPTDDRGVCLDIPHGYTALSEFDCPPISRKTRRKHRLRHHEHSTILHSQHIWPRVHETRSHSTCFHSTICLVPQNFEWQRLTENTRKH